MEALGETLVPPKESDMSDEMRIIPIDLENGKYAIKIADDADIDPETVARGVEEWLESDDPFMILGKGLKLVRLDANDIQEEA